MVVNSCPTIISLNVFVLYKSASIASTDRLGSLDLPEAVLLGDNKIDQPSYFSMLINLPLSSCSKSASSLETMAASDFLAASPCNFP